MLTKSSGITSITSNPFKARILEAILEWSRAGASDIHIFYDRPQNTIIEVRLNMYLSEVFRGQASHYKSYRIAIFELLKLDPMRDDDTMDQSITIDHFDFRVNYLPTKNGGAFVLRVIDRLKKFSLDSYPMPVDEKDRLRSVLNKAKGLIIVTGPTGSGKSSLMMNGLSSVVGQGRNIMSLEEPVEYRLEGIRQTEIEEGKPLTFQRALRAVLRQDPCVVFVGEVRDRETAETCIKLANKGHLTLATLHTNSAMGAIEALTDEGVDEKKLRKALLYLSGQMLVPKLCQKCLIDDPEGSKDLQEEFGELISAKISNGCSHCKETGRSGKVLLFESVYFKRGVEKASPTMVERGLDFVRKEVISAKTLLSHTA